jgi:hypothetical protein
MLSIAFVAGVILYFFKLTEAKNMALENGVSEDDYDVLRYGLWCYLVPLAITTLFPIIFQYFYLPLLLMLFFAPSIYYGFKIAQELDKGYDVVRRLSRSVSQSAMLGLGGIVLVVVSWGLSYLQVTTIMK